MTLFDTYSFSVDQYIEFAKQLDYIELLQDIDKRKDQISHMRLRDFYDKQNAKSFLSFLIRLGNVLEMGISVIYYEWQIEQIKPIIQALIEKGQLLPTILDK